MLQTRRRFIYTGTLAALGLGLGMSRTNRVHAAGLSPYGPLGTPDLNGVRLPPGFSARLIGVTGELVPNTSYEWHEAPDGGSTFAVSGGWVYVSNSESNGKTGGVSAIRFNSAGVIVDAYRILADTKWNCAGGATPWGTWLSCEEFRAGLVWECTPTGPGQGIARPKLGKFIHEAAAVDPVTSCVYLTEDEDNGRFYRFRPTAYGDLTDGVLEAAFVGAGNLVSWVEVPNTKPYRGHDTTPFDRGEGAWFDTVRQTVFFTTTTDSRVWAFDTLTSVIRIVYDAVNGGPLREPDNVTVAPSGQVFVAEDNDDLQLVMLTEQGTDWLASPFLQLEGHGSSEIAGPAFSPDGTRLYFSSQRGTDGKAGMTFEVTGPF